MTNINKIVLHILHASVNGIFGPYGRWSYANSLSSKTGFTYKSLMIEVNKGIYTKRNEKLNLNSRQWKRRVLSINRIYNTILDNGYQ